MTAIRIVAFHTVRELIRNRLMYVLLAFGTLLILGSLLVAQLTVGQWERLINDIGLATVQLAGGLVAILVGVGLIAGDVERRYVYVTLAKPIRRLQYVVGRYVGLCLCLAILVGLMGGAVATVLAVTDYPMGATGFYALLLILIELWMVAAFALVFSTFTTPTLGVIYSVGLFLVGHLTGDLLLFTEKLKGAARLGVGLLARVLPNLDLLNIKTHAANQLPVEGSFVVSAVSYGLLWATAAVALAATLFQKRDLK